MLLNTEHIENKSSFQQDSTIPSQPNAQNVEGAATDENDGGQLSDEDLGSKQVNKANLTQQ